MEIQEKEEEEEKNAGDEGNKQEESAGPIDKDPDTNLHQN